MDRITDHLPGGGVYVKSETGKEGTGAFTTMRRMPEIISRLAAYEDTGLEPDEVSYLKDYAVAKAVAEVKEFNGVTIDALISMAAAAKEDRLLVLPCAIGTPVWVHEILCSAGKLLTYEGCKYSQDCMRDGSIKCPFRVVKRAFTVNMRKGLGITFWLTKKEAEDAIPADRRP